jgi:hypothetical protein
MHFRFTDANPSSNSNSDSDHFFTSSAIDDDMSSLQQALQQPQTPQHAPLAPNPIDGLIALHAAGSINDE